MFVAKLRRNPGGNSAALRVLPNTLAMRIDDLLFEAKDVLSEAVVVC